MADHCCLCGRSLQHDEPQTCIWCLNRVRGDLNAIADLYALLPEEMMFRGGVSFDVVYRSADTRVPGGDALVHLAPGSPDARDPDATPGDPTPVAALLRNWALVFVADPDQPPARHLTAITGWLSARLTRLAQRHDAFADFASELRRLRAELERVNHAGDRPSHAPAPCTDCGNTLTRPYLRRRICSCGPRPRYTRWYGGGYDHDIWHHQLTTWETRHTDCDQGGLTDTWRCTGCGRNYSDAEYWLAIRAHLARDAS